QPETLREFAARLIAFRETLPPEQQLLLDTLLIAAVRPEWHEDIVAYWAAANGAHGPGQHGQPERPPRVTRLASGGETPQPHRHSPSPEQLRTFGEQLAAFGKTLPQEHRQLHDVILVVALRLDTGEDVETYWTQYNGIRTSPNPSWYSGSGAAAWNNTSWGTAWLDY